MVFGGFRQLKVPKIPEAPPLPNGNFHLSFFLDLFPNLSREFVKLRPNHSLAIHTSNTSKPVELNPLSVGLFVGWYCLSEISISQSFLAVET